MGLKSAVYNQERVIIVHVRHLSLIYFRVRRSSFGLARAPFPGLLQVNLFQKPSLLHHLTHNMTRDCSLNSQKNTSSQHVVYKNCFLFLFGHSKQYLYTTCCELVFFREFDEQSLVILWVNWFKNESFWKRFTCIRSDYYYIMCIRQTQSLYLVSRLVSRINLPRDLS